MSDLHLVDDSRTTGIQVTYIEQQNVWKYELVYTDGRGGHAGNLDILYKFENLTYQSIMDLEAVYLPVKPSGCGIIGYIIRPHSGEPFEWH